MKNGINYYIILVILLIIIGGLSVTYSVINNNTKFTLDSKTEKIYKDNYKIDINYPVFNNTKVNKDIKNIVDTEKDKFLELVKDNGSYENELNISYSYSTKDDIYSVHLRTYSYTGEDYEYNRKDKIIYFNKTNNKELTINDLIIDNEVYTIIMDEVYEYLNNHNKEITLYKDELLKEEIYNKDNYNIMIFSENYLYIVFSPHIVSPYDGDINIPISYSKIKRYLNTNYFKSLVEETVSKEEILSTNTRIRDAEEFKDKKLVALTFDDGPAYEKTETLLTEFEKRNVRVSFFMLGELAIKQQELVKKAYSMGHTIGSHTYDHKNLKKLDEEQLNYEINYTNEILKNIIGEDIKFIRPPYGSYNNEILEYVDMSFILWSVDTEDWKLKDAEKLALYMKDNIDDGDIVLLHDIHAETIDGVIQAIDIMQEEGYAFVSLEELIYYKGIDIETHTAYRYFKSIEEEIDNEIS